MNWWSSSSHEKATTAPSESARPQALSQPAPPPSSAPLDPDFYAAYPHLAPPTFSIPPNTSPATTSDMSASSSATAPPSTDSPDPTLPRTMSCRATFDSAFYCSSFGGHFNDIYRYGQLRSCSEHWSDFWFCMRTNNSYSSREEREAKVVERYAEKERKMREGPNSENIWRRRGVTEEVRGAFGEKVQQR